MLTDWIHWLSSIRPNQLWWYLLPLLLTDLPRYTIECVVVIFADLLRKLKVAYSGQTRTPPFCPQVCLVIVGFNEAKTIGRTLESVWDTYPNLEILIVDDGSNDEMHGVAKRFAVSHPGVRVLRKPNRGGKSSALNLAFTSTDAEVLVCVDADCELEADSIWKVVQPLRDPKVGAVSGNVVIGNAFESTATWLQAFEYLQCIFIGRRLSSRLGMLGIVSGAFGAFRREALVRTRGWDVGPGEDCDLSLKMRKCGFEVVFEPDANCLTVAKRTWIDLIKQRRRWDWGTVTFCCRKHADLMDPRLSHFRWQNMAWLMERWVFNIGLTYAIWAYAIWMCLSPSLQVINLLVLYYLVYVSLGVLQLIGVLYFSRNRKQDLWIGLSIPFLPFYHLFLRLVSLWAITEEFLVRRSFRDEFVPKHVREATWHW